MTPPRVESIDFDLAPMEHTHFQKRLTLPSVGGPMLSDAPVETESRFLNHSTRTRGL